MKITTCKDCNKEFEARENQKFCSDACKQRAYKKRKSGKPEVKKEILYKFKFSEYEKTKAKFKRSIDIVLFCFLRKNYTAEFKEEKFISYLNSLDVTFWDNYWDEATIEGKEFDKFRLLFYSGQVEVVE